jgi:hypothetical protein
MPSDQTAPAKESPVVPFPGSRGTTHLARMSAADMPAGLVLRACELAGDVDWDGTPPRTPPAWAGPSEAHPAVRLLAGWWNANAASPLRPAGGFQVWVPGDQPGAMVQLVEGLALPSTALAAARLSCAEAPGSLLFAFLKPARAAFPVTHWGDAPYAQPMTEVEYVSGLAAERTSLSPADPEFDPAWPGLAALAGLAVLAPGHYRALVEAAAA